MTEERRDQNYIRLHNTRLLLDIIKQHRPISRADLAKITKMSPTSITRIVGELQEMGLVHETALTSSGVGRRAVMLDLVPDSVYTVGIHIDKHQLQVCLVNFLMELVAIEHTNLENTTYTLQEVVHICLELYHKMVSSNDIPLQKVLGIGIGVVGVTNPSTRAVLLSPQFGWENAPVAEAFERVFRLPVVLENDVKASLIGEKQLMGIPPEVDTALLFVGSGVGCAASTEGCVIRGRQNAAGEVGHIVVDLKDGIPCECGRTGCLQTHMASPYLIAKAQEHNMEIRTLSQLREAYDAGAGWAMDLIDDCSRHICLALDILTNMYNPSRTIIGGSFFNEFRGILPEVVERFNQTSLVQNAISNQVLLSNSYGKACTMGGAFLAHTEFLPRLLSENRESVPYRSVHNPSISTGGTYLG